VAREARSINPLVGSLVQHPANRIMLDTPDDVIPKRDELVRIEEPAEIYIVLPS